jgi:hypothetical protein
MTIYQPNDDVPGTDAGAEVTEFLDEPPERRAEERDEDEDEPRPRPPSDASSSAGTAIPADGRDGGRRGATSSQPPGTPPPGGPAAA